MFGNRQAVGQPLQMNGETGFSSEIEPLKRIHLNSVSSYDLGPQGSIKTFLLVGLIAFLVMFLALTNFINLFVIEFEQRAKEIGVQKVNGAKISEVMTLPNKDCVIWI